MEQKKEHTFVANEEASTRGEKISLNRSIAIIGAGNMGTSLLRGILNAKLAPHDKIIVSGTHSAKLEKLGSKWKINHTLDNMHATQFADIVMLCVKPYTIGKVLDEILPGPARRPDADFHCCRRDDRFDSTADWEKQSDRPRNAEHSFHS